MRFIEGSVLVAYNAGFDLGFLEDALDKDRSALNDFYVIDALYLARRLFPAIGRYNLAHVARALGVHSGKEHRALSDAMMTWRIFEAALGMLVSQGVKRVDEVSRIRRRGMHGMRRVRDYTRSVIERAIREQKKLDITYRSVWSNKISKRTITPKQIHAGYDKAYVVAHCHLKDEERNFRLDGILNINLKK